MFSMMLVQASERRSWIGKPSRLTVRISSNPSRMLFETPRGVALQALGEVADQLFCLRRIVQFQAWRNTRRTEACRAGDSRSMIFRALWIWQR